MMKDKIDLEEDRSAEYVAWPMRDIQPGTELRYAWILSLEQFLTHEFFKLAK